MLAAFCGVTEQMIYQWERGDAAPRNLDRVAVGLGVPVEALKIGDERWDRHLQDIQPINAPDLFLPPTQWPVELSAERAEPFREKEEVAAPVAPEMPLPVPVAPEMPPPVPVAARMPTAPRHRLPYSVEDHLRSNKADPKRCVFCGLTPAQNPFLCDPCAENPH